MLVTYSCGRLSIVLKLLTVEKSDLVKRLHRRLKMELCLE